MTGDEQGGAVAVSRTYRPILHQLGNYALGRSSPSSSQTSRFNACHCQSCSVSIS